MLVAARNFAIRSLKDTLERAGLQVSFDLPVRNPTKLFALKARESGIKTVLDVGANLGQFALKLRQAGYGGGIVSFEPLSSAHRQLLQVSARDNAWKIAPRMALGSAPGSAEINVSRNLASSSLLGVLQRTVDVAPETTFVNKEEVVIVRLDDAVTQEWMPPFGMKLDTQGFELHVLRGAPLTLTNARLVMVEMSLVPLYEYGPSFVEVYQFLEQKGFRCISLVQTFDDRTRNELLQVDGIFMN